MPRSLIRLFASVLLVCGLAQAAETDAARAALARGDANAALAAVQRGLVQEPENAQLRFLLGVVRMDLGQDAQALAIFRLLHQSYPELPEPLNNIGLLQARAGLLESAMLSLQEALRADPQHRAARANLGEVYLLLAVQSWETWEKVAQASSVTPDPQVLRRLEGARALLALPGR
jgi:Flp pilus assembly protein TadD